MLVSSKRNNSGVKEGRNSDPAEDLHVLNKAETTTKNVI